MSASAARAVLYRGTFALGVLSFAGAFGMGVAQSWRTGRTLPELPYDELGQARAAFEAGDQTSAVRQLRTYALLQPQQADGWMRLGSTLWSTGDRPGAIAAFERALTLLPAPLEAHHALAILYSESGQLARALPHARVAREGGMTLPPALQEALARSEPAGP